MRLLPALFAAAAFPAIAATPVKMTVPMTAAQEVPGPGKGSGSAELTFDTDKAQVCYMLMAQGSDTPTMAHIHKGVAGVAGPPVAVLAPPANGMSEGCVALAADVQSAILATPSDYYVNVHSATAPAGTMRGQLAR